MRRLLLLIGTVLGLYAAARWWRQHPRVGTDFVNQTVNPWMERNGVIGDSNGELGLIEHVGRRSGIVRRTPVHPVRTVDGYRIIVPIGVRSEWARNVLAAQGCRLVVGGATLELDQPVLERPTDVPDLPAPMRPVLEWLGFRYLRLRAAEQTEANTGEPVRAPTAAAPEAAAA